MKAKTYDKQTAKFLAVVGENMPELSGDVMQGWIENPKAVQKALRNAFCPPEATTPRFNVWKTIKLGTGLKTADDFRRALEVGGCEINDWANDILGNPVFKVAAEETEVNLVKVTVAELGFKEGAGCGRIFERAKKLGLKLCSPEVGPQLRLQYRDQPNDESVLVAMEPILDSDGELGVFDVLRDGLELWLDSSGGYAGGFWGTSNQWVFVRPRSRK